MLLSCISFSRISDSMSTSLANLHVSQSLLFSLPFFLSPCLLFPKPLELIGWSHLPWASGFRNKCRNGFGQLLAAWYLYIHQIFGKKIEILRHAEASLSDSVDCPGRRFQFLARRDQSPTAHPPRFVWENFGLLFPFFFFFFFYSHLTPHSPTGMAGGSPRLTNTCAPTTTAAS